MALVASTILDLIKNMRAFGGILVVSVAVGVGVGVSLSSAGGLGERGAGRPLRRKGGPG